jgi:hypothetical protein
VGGNDREDEGKQIARKKKTRMKGEQKRKRKRNKI